MKNYIKKTMHHRFWEKVGHGLNGCWQWMGLKHKGGYGKFFETSKKSTYSHRYAYRELRGEVPAGLCLDHICRNRACVNPDHLEIVTNKENALRGVSFVAVNAKKTNCSRGHSLSGANLVMFPDGRRDCLACQKIRAAKGIAARRLRNIAKKKAAMLVLLLIVAMFPSHDLHAKEKGNFYGVRHVDCHDADSCNFLIPWLPPPFTSIKIRVEHVDAPEIGWRARCPQENAMAEAGRDAVNSLMRLAETIDLLDVEEPDIYGRNPARVVINQSIQWDKWLLEKGLAVPSKGKRVMDWCAEGGKKE